MHRKFTIFENDKDWRRKKRLQLAEENDYRRPVFTK